MKNSTDYIQPDFYHFSQDSIILAQYAFDNIESDYPLDILDLCSGCGVVGIELYTKLKEVKSFEFCELQGEYIPFFNTNLNFLNNIQKEKVKFKNTNFLEYKKSDSKFDLIVANPPYFDEHNHRASPNKNKNLCRLFVNTTLWELVETIMHVLKSTGKAHFLIRLDEHHGNKTWLSLVNKFESKYSDFYELRKKTIEGAHLVTILPLNIDIN